MAKSFASVLIDTYNHERFIEQAIVSVLEQDFPAADREIIVVDDGSTDRTPEIVKKFEPRVRLLRKVNGGQASAFNAGIPECKGEIVAFLDGDDWWAPKKLTRVIQAMTAESSVGIAGHGIINVQRDGREQAEILREGFLFQANTLEGARLFRRRGSFLGTSRMTIRADLLRRIGSVPGEIVIQADEYLFTLAAVLAGVRILPEALAYYRLHDANSFQLVGNDSQRLRRKQKSLAFLAKILSRQLESLGIEPQVRRAVVEYTQASAEQIRLAMDGGWPWETARTEWRLYEILHPDAPFSHRLFKFMILLGALVTPPKSFYSVHRTLAQSGLYHRARARLLPVPEMEHIQKKWRVG
ncbi:MAG TPA: glycosyltransferase family A protein [Candidatus Acidoferrum sp.]|nr:glycosyltransferase family A protein [Candidatus Acidoferrum sp.]